VLVSQDMMDVKMEYGVFLGQFHRLILQVITRRELLSEAENEGASKAHELCGMTASSLNPTCRLIRAGKVAKMGDNQTLEINGIQCQARARLASLATFSRKLHALAS
jgi:hypothetical protein